MILKKCKDDDNSDIGPLLRRLSRNLVLLGSAVSASEGLPFSGFPPGADVFQHNLGAVVTVDLAAPVELTVATGHHLRSPFLHPQAALVAQPAAASPLPLRQALAMLHALPALSAVQPERDVSPAVIWGILHVDEFGLGDTAKGVDQGPVALCAVPCPFALFVNVQFLGLTVLDL